MDLAQLTHRLSGTTAAGSPSETTIPCVAVGPIQRTVGLFGDELRVRIEADSIPVDWDLTKAMSVTFGQDDGVTPELVTLGGYYFARPHAMSFGELLPVGGGITATEWLLVLHTLPRRMREARGGLLTVGTKNPLGKDGRVDTGHADYMTYQELVDACLDAIGVPHDPCPSSINTAVDGTTPLVAPGPLDWGNARAIDELEALLAQVGYTAVFANDGSKISIVRLHRAGETLTIPAPVIAAADTFALERGLSLRGSTIVITSGRTRATIVTQRSFDDEIEAPLEWVAWDERTGAWLNGTEWTALYASEIPPGSIGAFASGPEATATGPEAMRRFAGIFSAVRLTGDDLTGRSRFITPSEAVGDGDMTVNATAAIIFVRACIHQGQSQFRNYPTADTDDPIRLDGIQAISGEGVFVLPGDLTYVRMTDTIGSYSEAEILATDDLTVVFAHEANTGDQIVDYFVTAWEVDATGGTLTVSQLIDGDLDAAIADPLSVKVEAPFLRKLMYQAPGDADPAWINETELTAVAEQIALERAGASLAQSAVVPVIGISNHEPGSIDGAVTAVQWDLAANRTLLFVGAHETPASFFERLESRARRSVAAGLRKFSQPGSSAGQIGTRAGSAPGELGGAGETTAPETMSGTRGRDAAHSGRAGMRAAGVRPGESAPRKAEIGRMLAKITGEGSLSSNRWLYDWTEVYLQDDKTFATGSRSSSTMGAALNLCEAFNTGSGIEGNGVDVDELFGTFALQPIQGGTVVELTGPYELGDVSGTVVWLFRATNAIDGSCEVA